MADTTASPPNPSIILHYLDSSRSHRILWLLEELKLTYTIQVHLRKSNRMAPDSLKAIHPLGKAPVLVLTSPTSPSESISIAESANIVEFLLQHYGPAYIPAQYAPGQNGPMGETEAYRRYRYLMHFAEGSMMPYLVFGVVFEQLKGPAVPFLVRPITRMIAAQVESMFLNPNLKANYDYLESFLAKDGDEYFCGKGLSGADFMLEFPVAGTKGKGMFTKESYPLLWAWSERITGRGMYKVAVKKAEEAMGKPFTLRM